MQIRKLLLAGILLSIFSLPVVSFGVNGAFDYGFSEITRGMGGSGVALPQDAVIAAINPAGMVFVGHRFDIGGIAYIPDMFYKASAAPTPFPAVIGNIAVAPGVHESKIQFFALPDFGINWMIDPRQSIGLSVYSLGGFGSEYSPRGAPATVCIPVGIFPVCTSMPGAFGAGTLASNLKQAVASVTYAHRFDRYSAIGVSLLIGAQMFDVSGIDNLAGFSNDAGSFSNRGPEFSIGIGVRAGLLLGFTKHFKVAISYQPKIYMSRFRKYSGLFPDQGHFNIPANGVVGLMIEPVKHIILTFDVQKIWNTGIKAYRNGDNAIRAGGSCTAGAGGPTCFGGARGPGFNWRDSIAYKLGVQWQASPKWIFRAGYNHAAAVIRSSNIVVNILAPGGVIEDLVSVGLTHVISKKNRINLVLVYVPPQSLSGSNPFITGGTSTQTISIHSSGFGIGASWSWILD